MSDAASEESPIERIRTVAFADGVITDAAGKTVATATGSLLVFPIGD
jgi:acyl-coenzyme A thioesterase PaaI-like protein